MSERKHKEKVRRENHINKELILLNQIIAQQEKIKTLRALVIGAAQLIKADSQESLDWAQRFAHWWALENQSESLRTDP